MLGTVYLPDKLVEYVHTTNGFTTSKPGRKEEAQCKATTHTYLTRVHVRMQPFLPVTKNERHYKYCAILK